jgi:hypothetical protein
MVLQSEFYDAYLAPDFSSFSGAILDDLSQIDPEQEHWLINFALNQLSYSLKPKLRELAFNHIRRTQGALAAYHQLRLLLASYPTCRNTTDCYFNALNQAEICISFSAQAFELANKFIKDASHQSSEYKHVTDKQIKRLHDFYILSKHIPNMLDGKQFESIDTVAFWLTNSGVKSRRKGLLSYHDLSVLLRELAHDASLLSNFLPPVAAPSA